jgi:phosphatidate cytidylyltransferase
VLRQRIATILIVLPLFLAALLWLPAPYWAVLTFLVTLLGLWEWAGLAGLSSIGKIAYLAASGLLSAAYGALWASGAGLGMSQAPGSRWLLIFASVFWLLIAPAWMAGQWQPRSPLLLAFVGWVVMLPTWLALVELRAVSPSTLLAFLLLVWVADITAYFTGKRFGRAKLAPAISPGKTWEGVAGAFAAVTLYACILVRWPGLAGKERALHGFGLVALFWLLTGLAIVGDLFESWMKRSRGCKDSGSLLPGHGGILDRIDALTATLPVAALVTLSLPTMAAASR